jgi:chromosome segregation ATPase
LPSAWNQLQRQAIELREYLLGRERELDRREAQLNARSAELENELRKARLRFSQQLQDVEIRQAELQQRAAALSDREQRLAASERALERRSAELYQVAEYLQQCAGQHAAVPAEAGDRPGPVAARREAASDFLLQPPSRRSAA